MNKRTLGLDWGEKRIGIAVTDPLNITAQPLLTISKTNFKAVLDELKKITEEYEIETVVVGIPLRTDGKKSEKAEQVRKWIEKVQAEFQHIHFVEMDERLTTVHAGRILSEAGVKAEKQKSFLDKISAALILEQFLQSKRP